MMWGGRGHTIQEGAGTGGVRISSTEDEDEEGRGAAMMTGYVRGA